MKKPVLIVIAGPTYVYDKFVDSAEPRLLFRVVDGMITREYGNLTQWATPVLNAIKIDVV